jgi:malonate transporter
MASNALLILPDLATILLGLLLARVWRDGYERAFWAGAERLVYYVMFPALLFTAINGAQFTLATEVRLLGAAVGAFLCAVALGFAARALLKPAADVFAGAVQTSFRYNSYVGLALAQTLVGPAGVAKLALILAICVPLANVFAVYALARHRRTHLVRELLTNPLIIATLAGLASNLLGLQLPQFAAQLLGRLGSASLALGLLCIGAGLTLAAAQASRWLLGYFSGIKLLVFPAAAYVLVLALGLTGADAQVVILFAALPTASSAYVLTVRMGANAAPVAFLITAQTLVSMLTLPLWVAIAPA